MIGRALSKVFGTKHERDIKKLQPRVDAINALEPTIQALSDEQIKARTDEFRQRLTAGETLDDLLTEAFATVREASIRALGMRHYDVQLIGGMVLHEGKIAEMKTGEGKTLVATLAVYLNALGGLGVHVVTVNDYLARRDAEWMAKVYEFLGMTVGVVQHGISDEERQKAYNSDITYATNNELGFDYLRDNMKFRIESMVQRPHNFAIVDEVDSILVDEARTPLIISGPSEESTDKYYALDKVAPRLTKGEEVEEGDQKYTTGDFLVDEKAHTVTLTDEGVSNVEKLLGLGNLYDMENIEVLHGVNQALRAHYMYKADVDYLVNEGQIVIVDEFTGRMMPGRRWSDGLHQAIEAKEGVKIERENQTLATITFQNYFRMYDKLAGMTGTADTEAAEFGEIYKLDVIVIPTNRPLDREDHGDLIFRSEEEKWGATIDDISDCNQRGQPVLVGTVSIERSEMLSKKLKKARIPHVVLNAKYHEREAAIVAQAGRLGAVTLATNMAGRGTDIVLGGNPEQLALAEANPEDDADAFAAAVQRFEPQCAEEREKVLGAGGLHILGTERHESRRIDNQLRGRSGRQGDAGSSQFYLSLDDDLMRIFGNDRLRNFVTRSMEEGVPIEARMVTRAIEKAQTQVEGRNFEMRKNLLEYDDVMNKQREAIYELRRDVLEGNEGRDYVRGLAADLVNYLVDTHCPQNADPRDWNLTEIATEMRANFDIDINKGRTLDDFGIDELRDYLNQMAVQRYDEQIDKNGDEEFKFVEKQVMLGLVDAHWKDHLLVLDHLKEGIHLRGHAQRDPKNEYKRESFDQFQAMKERVEDSILQRLYRIEPITREEIEALQQRRTPRAKPQEQVRRQPTPAFAGPPPESRGDQTAKPQPVVRDQPKVGRNDPCPCGSGKKYKKCHGRNN